MSRDLDSCSQELVKIQSPKIKINETSQSCDDVIIDRSEKDFSDEDDEYHTPRSTEHMIPTILCCPPAPKKPSRVVPSCKRKLFELDFGVNGRDDTYCARKRSCLRMPQMLMTAAPRREAAQQYWMRVRHFEADEHHYRRPPIKSTIEFFRSSGLGGRAYRDC